MTLWQQRKLLLSDRNFLFFLFASIITVMGGAMGYIALTWTVVSLNAHPFYSGVLVSLSFWLPSVLLGPLAGVLVDRYRRRNVLIMVNVIRTAAFFIFSVLLYVWHSLWLCCLLSLLNGLTFTVVNPAVMALVRELVPHDRLLAANSTVDACIESANVIGMAIVSVLIIWFSITWILALIAICIGLGAVLLFRIRQSRQDQYHHSQRSSPWQEMKIGWQYLRRRPFLICLYVLSTILFVQFMISPILLAPYIKTVIHGTGQDFSLVELSLSVGIIAGSFMLPWCCQRFGRIVTLIVASCWLSVIFLFISLTHHVSSLVALYAMLGLGLPLWTVIASYSQEHTEKSMQGRVQSFANTASSSCLFVVYLLLALGHSHVLIAHAYWFCTALGVLALILIWALKAFELPLTAA